MDMQAFRVNGYTLLRISGELDIASAPEVRAFLRATVAEGDARLVADVTDLSFIDAAGISVLLDADRYAAGHGGWLRLVGASAHFRRILRILHLTRTLRVYDTVQDATDRAVDVIPSTRSRCQRCERVGRGRGSRGQICVDGRAEQGLVRVGSGRRAASPSLRTRPVRSSGRRSR